MQPPSLSHVDSSRKELYFALPKPPRALDADEEESLLETFPSVQPIVVNNALTNFEIQYASLAAECGNHPLLLEMLDKMVELKRKNDDQEKTIDKLKYVINKHPQAILDDISMNLYSLISRSPALKKKLENFVKEEKDVGLLEMVDKLDRELKNNHEKTKDLTGEWVLLDTVKEPIELDTDEFIIEDLRNQIHIIDKAVQGKINSLSFLIDMQKLEKSIKAGKNELVPRICSAGAQSVKVLSWMFHICRFAMVLAPSLTVITRIMFPAASINIIKILLNIIIG